MSDPEVGEILSSTEEKMHKAVLVTQEEFAGVRTGRANSGLVERLKVDYYGAPTPMQQLATFSVPENRVLAINVFDKAAVASVEKAIRDSNLGLMPSTDGNIVRLNFPPLTGERRKELVKLVKQKAEEGRVSVRNHRHAAKKKLEGLESDGAISKDELQRSEKDLQTLTDRYTGEIDGLCKHKEQELLED